MGKHPQTHQREDTAADHWLAATAEPRGRLVEEHGVGLLEHLPREAADDITRNGLPPPAAALYVETAPRLLAVDLVKVHCQQNKLQAASAADQQAVAIASPDIPGVPCIPGPAIPWQSCLPPD